MPGTSAGHIVRGCGSLTISPRRFPMRLCIQGVTTGRNGRGGAAVPREEERDRRKFRWRREEESAAELFGQMTFRPMPFWGGRSGSWEEERNRRAFRRPQGGGEGRRTLEALSPLRGAGRYLVRRPQGGGGGSPLVRRPREEERATEWIGHIMRPVLVAPPGRRAVAPSSLRAQGGGESPVRETYLP